MIKEATIIVIPFDEKSLDNGSFSELIINIKSKTEKYKIYGVCKYSINDERILKINKFFKEIKLLKVRDLNFVSICKAINDSNVVKTGFLLVYPGIYFEENIEQQIEKFNNNIIKAGIYGGLILSKDRKVIHSGIIFPKDKLFHNIHSGFSEYEKVIFEQRFYSAVDGYILYVKMSTFKKIGLPTNKKSGQIQFHDYCLRAVNNGISVAYIPELRAICFEDRFIGKSSNVDVEKMLEDYREYLVNINERK